MTENGSLYVIETSEEGRPIVNGEEVACVVLGFINSSGDYAYHITGEQWASSMVTDMLKGAQITKLMEDAEDQ